MSTPEDQRGSPSATEEVQLLFVRHENSIRTFVRALQPSLADADDVLQETFLTVSRKASTFELKGKPFWKEHRFRINDANFGAEQGADIRIKVEGASPLLGMVVIASPAAQK